MMPKIKTYEELVGSSPNMSLDFSDQELLSLIKNKYDSIIILDDDPTGTQTVHDIPILTRWTKEIIFNELKAGTFLFYILTNSRSLDHASAASLGQEIANNIKQASKALSKDCLIISRSDSTLRGHYPLELEILIDTFSTHPFVQFVVPAFFEGGRYTIDNIHYVKEGQQMIPAAETPFAQDKVFGYSTSDMIDWLRDKYDNDLGHRQVHFLSIADLETRQAVHLIQKIDDYNEGDICIINASNYAHLKKALYCIFSSDITPLFRSAASLVSALLGQSAKYLDAEMMSLHPNRGGLTILGSYVLKSTKQLSDVLQNLKIEALEIDVDAVLDNKASTPEAQAQIIDTHILKGENVILYTSRQLISKKGRYENLKIGQIISSYITSIVKSLTIEPSYIIGKGGITSSDLATEALQIDRALVLGQIIDGVPVWKADKTSKFPQTTFIVFPGNVGDSKSLTQVIQKLNKV